MGVHIGYRKGMLCMTSTWQISTKLYKIKSWIWILLIKEWEIIKGLWVGNLNSNSVLLLANGLELNIDY